MAANYWSLNGGLLRNFGGISDDSIDGDLSFLIYEGTVFSVSRKACLAAQSNYRRLDKMWDSKAKAHPSIDIDIGM